MCLYVDLCRRKDGRRWVISGLLLGEGEFEPRGFFPKVFERAVAVMVDPDTAQGILHEEDGYAYQFAADNAHLKMEPPVVEDERSDDALCDVVGHAHAAIGDEQGEDAGEFRGAIITEKYAADQYQHETKLIERRYDGT